MALGEPGRSAIWRAETMPVSSMTIMLPSRPAWICRPAEMFERGVLGKADFDLLVDRAADRLNRRFEDYWSSCLKPTWLYIYALRPFPAN